jgi:rhamnosyltransferase
MPDGTPPAPRVTVLLATWNGREFLPEQLATILDQQGVELEVLVGDDGSTDGTREWLAEQAAVDPRVVLRSAETPTGSSAANFYRLLEAVDPADDGYVAFSDQDDVWLSGKLARGVRMLRERGADGFSSDVIAFYPDGREEPIVKSAPQRSHDYLLESPGPGNTFVLTARLVRLVQRVLHAEPLARGIDFHDWLVYAVCRAHGWGWVIDDEPLLRYRQHAANVMGANHGRGAASARLRLIRSHWHREQARRLAVIAGGVAPDDAARDDLGRWEELFVDGSVASRLALARRAGSLRRRPRDRAVIAGLVLTGVW